MQVESRDWLEVKQEGHGNVQIREGESGVI